MSDVRLATIPRRNGEELRVEISQYQGRCYVHVRLWFRGSDGDMKPGKGVALRSNELMEVSSSLERAAERIDRDGRLLPEQRRDDDPTEGW